LGGLLLRRRPPQRVVLGRQPAGEPIGDELLDLRRERRLVAVAEEQLVVRAPRSVERIARDGVPGRLRGAGVGHGRALSSWPSMVSTSSCQDFSNFST